MNLIWDGIAAVVTGVMWLGDRLLCIADREPCAWANRTHEPLDGER